MITPSEGKFSSILLFGPPGSGKGTLGKFLTNSGKQFHLSSGDIFRGLASDSPAGKLFYSFASQGLLLPDEETIEIWKYYVQGLIATNRFFPRTQDLLLDGIPRTVKQVEMLKDYLVVRHIIVLEVENREELLQRMELRARIERRLDDTSVSILETRIELYHSELNEILNLYPPHLVTKIDGDQPRLEVLRDVLVRLSHVLSAGPNSKK